MVGEEQVDKTPAEVPTTSTSDVPTEIPTKAPKNTSEVPTTSPAEGAPFICDECGKPFDTKKALSGHMSVHSKKPTETTDEDLPDDFLDEREILDRIIAEATPTRKRKSIVRLASRHLGNKRESIEALAEALRLADMQPHLRNLILKNWAAHMDIPDIEDILDVEDEEKKKKDEEKKTEEDIEKKTPRNLEEVLKKGRDRKFDRLDSLQVDREIAELEKQIARGTVDDHKEGIDRPLTTKDLELWKLQEENRRLQERDDGHRINPDSEMRERVTKLEDELRQRDADRMQRLEDEIKAAKNTPPPQSSTTYSKEEVAQLVERSIDDRTKKLTIDDVDNRINQRVNDFRSVTKEEWDYRKAADNYRLEEKKLDESGKTRDVIGRAVRDGFERFGKIVLRMEGSDTGMPVEGYMDQAGKMVQVVCPTHLGGCGAVMTAPINSSRITCIRCGKIWDVLPPKTEEKKPPAEDFVPKEKKVIEKSLEDAKPLETSDAPKVMPEQTTDARVSSEPVIDVPKDVEKIAENIAIGEAADKLEEELKKKKEQPVEKKPWPTIDSNICPICNKKCKGKRGVGVHITVVHPEYEK